MKESEWPVLAHSLFFCTYTVMKIIKANVLGYCMGVKKACEAVETALETNKPVYTLGPLIHNNSALKDFESRGVRILDTVNLQPATEEAIVIIRAHGVPPAVKQDLQKMGYTIIDSTCPRVISSQKRAAEYSEKGYQVIIAGDKNHGEVEGIAGCVTSADALIVENANDARTICVERKKVILLAQTTITDTEYAQISAVLKDKIPNIKVFNTICSATATRQQALKELCTKVEGVLIIGGKNSANTARLYKTACENCNRAALIEDANEIPEDFFTLSTVGLSAGASTPDFVIAKVEQILYNN